MPIFSGSTEITAATGIYSGSTPVREVYSGPNSVWDNGIEYSDDFWANTVSLHPLQDLTYEQKVSGGPSLTASAGIDPIAATSVDSYTGVRLGHTRANTTDNGSILSFSSVPLVTAGDFTIEFWVYLYRVGVSPDTHDMLFGNTDDGNTAGARWKIWRVSSNYSFLTNSSTVASGSGLTTGEWQHVAVCRSGTTLRVFMNGLLIGSVTTGDTIGSTLYPLALGALSKASDRNYTCDALFRQVRMTTAARYTASFRPKRFFYYPGIS